MVTPRENQQTVEALAETVRDALHTLYAYTSDDANPPGNGRSATHAEGRAALRDLVAQAELVAELRTALEMDEDTFAAVGNWVAGVQEPHAAVLAGIDERIGANRALLARLDGAR